MKEVVLKKVLTVVFCFVFLLCNTVVAQPPIIDDAPELDPNRVYPEVTADNLDEMTGTAAVVMDAVSGRILFSKNPDVPHYPASTTKILTALMAIERGNLDDVVKIDDRAVGQEGSSIYLDEGDELTVRDLVQATMLASGNDGAEALAYLLGDGSMDNFLKKMNQRAVEIGATHSHFDNPHGLPDKNHYSTAMDLAVIARFALFNPTFKEVVAQKQKTITWKKPEEKENEYFNTNRLLWNYDDVNGIKTGYTEEAGGCLAASATQKGTTLVAVVLQTIDSHSRFTESRALLDYGFREVKSRVNVPDEELEDAVFVHDAKQSRVKLVPVEEFSYPLLAGEKAEDFSCKLETPKFVTGPLPKGTAVGRIILYKKGEPVGSMPLVTAEELEPGFNIIGYIHGLIFR